MNPKQKRSRSLNWDEKEKLLFQSVLKEYAHIIENKSLDTNTNKKKTEAWDEVHKKFNELNGRHRQLSQLKIQWKSMKVNVRKSYSTFRNDCNKTGGGERPATPDDIVLQIKDLLNPAELLIDHNIYDSDGIIPSSSENKVIISETSITNQQGNSSETTKLLESKPIADVVKALDTCTKFDNIKHYNQQTADVCIETIDVDALAEHTPLVISQDNDVIVDTPIQRKLSTSTVKKISQDNDAMIVISQDNDAIVDTPIQRKLSTSTVKKVPKRKISSNITDSGLKSRKDHNDYISSMISHSKMLKDEEHKKRMEMAEKEHSIIMAIHEEKLKSAILEREILEIRKKHEEKN